MIKQVIVLLTAATITTSALAADKKLSLKESLKTAVERNLDIHLERVNLNSSRIDLGQTRAVYEPTMTSRLSTSSSDVEATNRNEGAPGETVTAENITFNNTFSKRQDWGFSWRATFDNRQDESTSAISLGTTINTNFSIGFEQQLLRGFSLDRAIPRTDEYVARGNLAISEMDMELRVADILQNTENAYWDLVQAIEQLKVSKQSLELAKQLYEQNRVKIEVGTLAPIELVNTEAAIADREREVVTNENAVLAAEDALKNVMNLPDDDWFTTLTPTEPLDISEMATDLKTDYAKALGQRVEMRKNDRQTKNARLTQRLRENELKPELVFGATYFAQGADATTFREDGSVLDPLYTDALSKVADQDFPGWQVSLDLSWTPFNKAAKLNKAKADVEIRRQELLTQQTKQTIREDVRGAYRELEGANKTIKANEKALKFREENLKAEVQKFQNGLSTNYRVAEVQEELAVAESALINSKITYLKAKVAYHKALGRLPQERRITVK